MEAEIQVRMTNFTVNEYCSGTMINIWLLNSSYFIVILFPVARRYSNSREDSRGGFETEYHYGHQPSDASEIFAQEHVRFLCVELLLIIHS